jgi:hypothetical protein
MANVVEIVVALAAVLLCSALLFQFAGRYVYNYQVTGRGIEIVLFGRFPLKRVPFNNIAEVRVGPTTREMLPFKGIAFGNRVWGQTVLVRQKTGLVRRLFITPDNPEQFVRKVREQLPPVSP